MADPVVQYRYGSESSYRALAVKDPYTFYKTEKNLYLGETKLSNSGDVQGALDLIQGTGSDAMDLSNLTTENKTSIIAAINEIASKVGTSTGTMTW